MENPDVLKREKVWFSELLPARCPVTFAGLKKVLERYGVEYGLLKGTKDIWCRDYMPIPVFDYSNVLFGYRPDYLLESPELESTISDNMAVCMENGIGLTIKNGSGDRSVDGDRSGRSGSSGSGGSSSGVRLIDCRGIIVDGGNVIRCGNKVIMTAKVLEENPGWTPRALLEQLERLLCCEVVLVPWDTEEFYGHADGLVRAVSPDTVVMTNYSQFDPDMAWRIKNCLKPHFKVKELKYKVRTPYENNWAYINWLQTDDVLILPKFNVPEDEQAFRQISKLMPEYAGCIEMVDATDLIIHEGCFNCCSWNSLVR